MKKIELVLLLLLMSAISFAQQKVYPTKNLDTYVGTWLYQSNDTIFKIVLKRGYAESKRERINALVGGYSLTVKGVCIEDYLNISSTVWHLDNNKPIGFYIWASNNAINLSYIDPNRVGVIFYDQRKKHMEGGGMPGGEILILSPDKIRWHLDEKQGLAIEDSGKYVPIGFSVPSDVIMTREK